MVNKEQIENLLKNQKDGDLICPHCGSPLMSKRIHTNALSRQADVMVCDMYGIDEALRAMTGDIFPFEEWDIIKMNKELSNRRLAPCNRKIAATVWRLGGYFFIANM